jgi:hypothetical protein
MRLSARDPPGPLAVRRRLQHDKATSAPPIQENALPQKQSWTEFKQGRQTQQRRRSSCDFPSPWVSTAAASLPHHVSRWAKLGPRLPDYAAKYHSCSTSVPEALFRKRASSAEQYDWIRAAGRRAYDAKSFLLSAKFLALIRLCMWLRVI